MPLYVVATPIGNLDEASPRMRTILGEADLVLCEDTRRTRTLVAALEISAPKLVSCHAHNESERIHDVMQRLERGETIAVVSDAGMPCVSDPGGQIVAAAHEAGAPVHVVSGPSSVTAAIAVSGFPGTPFHFLGFPPRKVGALRKTIIEASALPGIVVFLESGRRVGKVVAVLGELLPDREAVIARELTKHFEEVIRGRTIDLPTTEQRGEVVLVIGPGEPIVGAVEEVGPDLKTIAAALATRWGCTKREAYNQLLALESDRSD
jgi:16S rRNA (cytidine1402-2'-O)-methyltransferase